MAPWHTRSSFSSRSGVPSISCPAPHGRSRMLLAARWRATSRSRSRASRAALPSGRLRGSRWHCSEAARARSKTSAPRPWPTRFNGCTERCPGRRSAGDPAPPPPSSPSAGACSCSTVSSEPSSARREPAHPARATPSLIRSAFARIVSTGFTPPLVTCVDPSAITMLSWPHTRPSAPTTELRESVPIRQVPAWCYPALGGERGPIGTIGRTSTAPASRSHASVRSLSISRLRKFSGCRLPLSRTVDRPKRSRGSVSIRTRELAEVTS